MFLEIEMIEESLGVIGSDDDVYLGFNSYSLLVTFYREKANCCIKLSLLILQMKGSWAKY